MKEKRTPHIIAVMALTVFIVLGLACASSSYYVRKIPKNLQKTYSETVTVPDVPLEDMLLKIHLYIVEAITNYHLGSSVTKDGKTVWKFYNTFYPSDEDRLEVSIENGRYRIDYTPISILSDSKDFKEEISERGEFFQTFTKNLKTWFFLEPYTFTEMDTMMENGYTLYKQGKYEDARQEFRRVAIEDPYDADALVHYASCLMQIAEARPIWPPKADEEDEIWNFEWEISYYNKAIAVSSLMPDQQDAVKITQLCQKRRQELQQVESQRVQAHQVRQEELRKAREENWDNVIQSLNNLSNSIAQIQQNQSGGSQSSYGNATATGSQSSNTADAGNYQSRYDRFARQVESNVSSLDRMDKGTSAYNQMKRTMRANQQDMRRIRTEARNNGVTITISDWENFVYKD